MDSGNSESLQSSSDDHEVAAPPNHSSFFLPPFQQPPSSSTFYGDPTTLSFVNNLISDDILNQNNLLPLPPPPPHPLPPSSRNPRKRTRASRRAPTTVLSTDTSNFRAMVQEFTGVPSSPFSSATRRFDIFRSPSDPLSYNPFRPIPQKPHLQPSTSMNFPDLPLHHYNQQISTFQSLLSHQHHHIQQTTLSSLQDLDSINLGALQKNHPEDDQQLMMRQFSEFEKPPEIHNNFCSSSTSDPNKDSSGTTTTTVDPWICPTDSNN